MAKYRPTRAPAFRCPDHGWITVDRLKTSKAREDIFYANYRRLAGRPNADVDKVWAEAETITSLSEADLLGALRFYGMEPELQHPVGRFFADFCFPNERLVVEVDGRDWHNFERDTRRDNQIAQLGYRTIRFYASDVWADPVNCARTVRCTLDDIRRKQAA